MNASGRSYEAVREATRRTHLMPVQPATLPIRRWEARATYAVVGLATITVAFIWAVQS